MNASLLPSSQEASESDGYRIHSDSPNPAEEIAELKALQRNVRRKVDLRLCTIAGILCSLNLLDSGIISSASVTSIFEDLGLGEGNRYSIAIIVYTISNVAFQLPATIAVRTFGPRIWFASITFAFGLITLCTAFITSWRQMIALRVLLGIAQAGIFPGLTYLISTWYTREEQQLRFAFLQSGEVTIVGLGAFLNYGLNHLDGRGGLRGWRWMFLVQGIIACIIGVVTFWWIVDFPDACEKSFKFLTREEIDLAVARIQADRGDAEVDPFSWSKVFVNLGDLKIYGFCALFFCLNLVSTSYAWTNHSVNLLNGLIRSRKTFLLLADNDGMGFDSNQSILLSAPPYFYAVIPALFSSWISDAFQLRGAVISFNAVCTIAGFGMLGFSNQVAVRYVGTYLATGAYISNWAALNAYQANNIVGQWKRAFASAAVTACNGLGGVAGSFIVRQNEAPRYITAIWVSIGSHIFIVAIVACFTIYFLVANSRQRNGKQIIENTVGFLSPDIAMQHADDREGGISSYFLTRQLPLPHDEV